MTPDLPYEVSWPRAFTLGFVLLVTLPLLPWRLTKHKPRVPLLFMRASWIAFVIVLPILLSDLLPLTRNMQSLPLPAFGWVLLASLPLDPGGMSWITKQSRRRDPASAGDPAAILTAYFLRMAGAAAPALMGFVLVFVAGALWPYLLGLLVASPFLFAVMPTRRWISRQQALADDAGLSVDVAEALSRRWSPPPSAENTSRIDIGSGR